MVAADDAKDHATVLRAGSIDLGTIKGNIGDQDDSLGLMWTARNTAAFPWGANGSVLISELGHERLIAQYRKKQHVQAHIGLVFSGSAHHPKTKS